MAGQKKCHHLVSELLVAHLTAALVIPGVEKHRQQIAPVLAACAPLDDDGFEDPLQPAYGLLDPQIQGRGNPVGRCHDVAAPRDESSHQGFQGRADIDRLAADLRVKERLGHNLQSQVHHVGLNIADLAVFPRLEHFLRVIHHKPAVVGDSLAIKCGLGQLTLTCARSLLHWSTGPRPASAASA